MTSPVAVRSKWCKGEKHRTKHQKIGNLIKLGAEEIYGKIFSRNSVIDNLFWEI